LFQLEQRLPHSAVHTTAEGSLMSKDPAVATLELPAVTKQLVQRLGQGVVVADDPVVKLGQSSLTRVGH
jgi:hypothetical protein